MWLDEYPKQRDKAGPLDAVLLPSMRLHLCVTLGPIRLRDGSLWHKEWTWIEKLMAQVEANYDRERRLKKHGDDAEL